MCFLKPESIGKPQKNKSTLFIGRFENFDLLKAFGYIERVVKSDFYFGNYQILHHMCATFSELPYNISTMDAP